METADMKHWPFKVVSGTCGTPIIEVDYKGGKKQFKAEERKVEVYVSVNWRKLA